MNPALYFEVDHAAQDLGRKGLTGAIGDSLPNLMSSAAVQWINANQEQFQRMVSWWRKATTKG